MLMAFLGLCAVELKVILGRCFTLHLGPARNPRLRVHSRAARWLIGTLLERDLFPVLRARYGRQ